MGASAVLHKNCMVFAASCIRERLQKRVRLVFSRVRFVRRGKQIRADVGSAPVSIRRRPPICLPLVLYRLGIALYSDKQQLFRRPARVFETNGSGLKTLGNASGAAQ